MDRLKAIRKSLPHLTVEPIALFTSLGFQLWVTGFQTGLYQIVCYQLYHNESTIDCYGTIDDITTQNRIQQELSKWMMLLLMAFMVPSIISSVFLGAWSDSAGRKTTLLLPIAGLIISVFPWSVIFTFRLTPLWVFVPFHIVGGSMGFLSLLLTSSMAYISDVSLDRKGMTIRMVLFAVLQSIADVVGSLLSGSLLGRVELPVVIVIIEVIFTLTFFYVLILLHQLPPEAMKLKILMEQQGGGEINNKADKTPADSKKVVPDSDKKSCLSIPLYVINLLKQIVQNYMKKRPGKQRTFLIMSALVLFLHLMADAGLKGNIIGQYVFRDPFNWTDGSKLGFWKATGDILSFIGNLVSIIVFKKLLKLQDTSILLISILSGVSELIIIGFSKSDWMLYLAIVLGCLGKLVMPVMASFTTQLVGIDEVGKSYVAHSLSSNLALIASTAIFQTVYQATLEWYPGFVFFFGAGILTLCFSVMLWIHIINMRQNKIADNNNTDKDKPGTIHCTNSSYEEEKL